MLRPPRGIGPEDGRQAHGLGFQDELAEVLVLDVAIAAAGINRVANGGATQAQGVLHRARDGRAGFVAFAQDVAVVELQDERDVARVVASHMLDEAQGRGVGVASAFDGQLNVVAGIVAAGIGREGARGTMLKTLVHGQDHEFTRAREAACVHHPRQIGFDAGVFRRIPGQDFLHAGVAIIHLDGSILHGSPGLPEG